MEIGESKRAGGQERVRESERERASESDKWKKGKLYAENCIYGEEYPENECATSVWLFPKNTSCRTLGNYSICSVRLACVRMYLIYVVYNDRVPRSLIHIRFARTRTHSTRYTAHAYKCREKQFGLTTHVLCNARQQQQHGLIHGSCHPSIYNTHSLYTRIRCRTKNIPCNFASERHSTKKDQKKWKRLQTRVSVEESSSGGGGSDGEGKNESK